MEWQDRAEAVKRGFEICDGSFVTVYIKLKNARKIDIGKVAVIDYWEKGPKKFRKEVEQIKREYIQNEQQKT